MLDRWKNCKESYNDRIEQMSRFLYEPRSVLDIGCGQQTLREYLPKDVDYYGCDLIKRDENTIVCDFNDCTFPKLGYYTWVFCSGVLEYINDLELFMYNIGEHGGEFIFSYAVNTSNVEDRQKNGWVNHHTKTEFETLLSSHFKINNCEKWKNQYIFYLSHYEQTRI